MKAEKLKKEDPKYFAKSTFVEPETTHVIEYGIHPSDQKTTAEVKAIKEKKRKAREEARRQEEEAKKKQKELIAAAKAKKKKTVHGINTSIAYNIVLDIFYFVDVVIIKSPKL